MAELVNEHQHAEHQYERQDRGQRRCGRKYGTRCGPRQRSTTCPAKRDFRAQRNRTRITPRLCRAQATDAIILPRRVARMPRPTPSRASERIRAAVAECRASVQYTAYGDGDVAGTRSAAARTYPRQSRSRHDRMVADAAAGAQARRARAEGQGNCSLVRLLEFEPPEKPRGRAAAWPSPRRDGHASVWAIGIRMSGRAQLGQHAAVGDSTPCRGSPIAGAPARRCARSAMSNKQRRLNDLEPLVHHGGAESMLIFAPMDQTGCRSAASGVGAPHLIQARPCGMGRPKR